MVAAERNQASVVEVACLELLAHQIADQNSASVAQDSAAPRLWQ